MSRVKEELDKREFKRAVQPEQPCDARQVSDQMSCTRCGYLWDMNDPEPPQCKRRNTPTERPAVNNRTLVTGQEPVVDRFSMPNRIDKLRAEWSKKDRSVGRAHLDQLKRRFKV